MNWYRNRRRFLQGVGAASAGLLAGCNTDESADERSSTAAQLFRLFADDYRGDTLSFESFRPATLGGFRKTVAYLQPLDRAIPAAFDVDVQSLERGHVALGGAVASLTAPSDVSFADALDEPGTESGTVGDYTVYEHSTGVVALDGNRFVVVRPDDRLGIDPRDALRRYLEAESGDGETSPDGRGELAVETAGAVDGEHYLGVAVPFDGELFDDETTFVPGGRSVAWGATTERTDDGNATVRTKLVARFPPDADKRAAFLPYITHREPVQVDVLSTEYDEETVSATDEQETRPRSGRSKYLRPRGMDDPVIVTARPDLRTWTFEYPGYDVSGATELVLPVDRPAVLEGRGSESWHDLLNHRAGLDFEVHTDRYLYQAFTPSTTGEYTLECRSNHDGADEHTAEARFVDGATFDAWVSEQ